MVNKVSRYLSKQSAEGDAKIIRKRGYKTKITHSPQKNAKGLSKQFTWKLQSSKIRQLTKRGGPTKRFSKTKGKIAAKKRGSRAFRRRR